MYSASDAIVLTGDRTLPFSFTGGFLNDSDIHVYNLDDDGVEITSGWELQSATTVRFDNVMTEDTLFRVRRIMPKDDTLYKFIGGSAFTSGENYNTMRQMLFCVHEALDGFIDPAQQTDIDMLNLFKIRNLVDGTDAQDAATLQNLADAENIGINPGLYAQLAGATFTGDVAVPDLSANGSITTDMIDEHTSGVGVTIEGVEIKDGLVEGVDVPALEDTVNDLPSDNTPIPDGEPGTNTDVSRSDHTHASLYNPIINGDMRIAQRGTSFIAISNGTYSLDRFQYGKTNAVVHTITREVDGPSTHPELRYSLKCDCTTMAVMGVADHCSINQIIEGYNFAPMVGKTYILSFWVKATKVGTYCISIQNSDASRSYVSEYTVDITDTWEFKEVVVPFDYSGGTWDYTNGVGLRCIWVLGAGTNYQGAADTWHSGTRLATSNQVNACSSVDNNFSLTGIQFNQGSIAVPFVPRLLAEELALCRRYYARYDYDMNGGVSYPIGSGAHQSDTSFYFVIHLDTNMRVIPTLSFSGTDAILVLSGGGGKVSTNITTYAMSKTIVSLIITVASGANGNGGSAFINGAGRFIDFTAEL